MRFRSIRARKFRNFAFLEAAFPGGAQFVRGNNGQGKTNLLEALGLVTSLRSFRTSDSSALIRWNTHPPEALLLYELEHEQLGETILEIRIQPGSKRILLDGNPVRRMGEILGSFPTITFSSQDIQILRGAPSLRRRLMDMMFVVMDTGYYTLLTRYYKALKARNALLKGGAPAAHRRPFENQLIEGGWELTHLRGRLLEAFGQHFRTAYAGISGTDETPELAYHPSIHTDGPTAYEAAFLASANRDRETGTTNRGPHRDDLRFRLLGHPAREFASEGQQRGLVLALRMGLVDWYRMRGGTPPVILADDIVGELDPSRRRGFWQMLGTGSQIIATGTTFPGEDASRSWSLWEMQDGELAAMEAEAGK
ncbi:MAG: DNA replication and repair protein RecF [Oceanipulchritudo sp.]